MKEFMKNQNNKKSHIREGSVGVRTDQHLYCICIASIEHIRPIGR